MSVEVPWSKVTPFALFEENKELKKELEKREKELEEVKKMLNMCENRKFLEEILQEKDEKIKLLNKDLNIMDQKVNMLQEELKKYKERITEEDIKKSQELKERIIQEIDVDKIMEHDALVYHPDDRPPIEQQQDGSPVIEVNTRPLSGDRIHIPIIVATIESEVVFPTAEKTLYLIAGRRRLNHYKYFLKQKTIPAVVLHLKDLKEALEINYRENFDRTDMGWFMQAKAIGEYRKQTLYPDAKIAEIFNLSKNYVDKLIWLYDFVISHHHSDEKIIYEGKEYYTDLSDGLVEIVPVDWYEVTNIKRRVNFDKAWKIYRYHVEQEELKKKEEEEKKWKEKAEALKVLISKPPEKEEYVPLPEVAKELGMTEEEIVKTAKEIKEKKEIEELEESLTPSEKAEISKAHVDIIYFEIPLKFTKDPEIKLCLGFQQGKCPFIKKIPPDLWKGIEEIKKQKEGSWINLSTEDFIINGATYWIMQKVHELRRLKELSEEERKEEKKKVEKMRKIFQKKHLKVDLGDYVQE